MCAYVNTKFDVNVCDDLTVNDGHSDSLFVELNTTDGKKLIVGIIYRPPNFNPDIFRQKLEETLHNICEKKQNCVILGDYNIDIAKNDKTKKDFMNTLHSFNFFTTINTFTRVTQRSKTIIDNFITNIAQENIDSGVILSGISDHFPIVLFMKLPKKLKIDTYKDKIMVLNEKTLTNLRTYMQHKTSTAVMTLTWHMNF